MGSVFVGLDVSDKTTSVCIVNIDGKPIFETSVATTAKALVEVLKPYKRSLKTVGLESGSRAIKLHKSLARLKYPVVSMDAFHAHSALQAKLNKTDTNDARGLALLLAKGMYSTAYVKTDEAYAYRTIITLREIMLRKTIGLELALDNARRLVGPEYVPPRRGPKPHRTETQVAVNNALLAFGAGIEGLKTQNDALERSVKAIAKGDPVCCRLMTIPGVGPITALIFMVAIDDPHRFESSRNVAAYLGLTPRVFQSGSISRSGGISHRGDNLTRKALFTAARTMLLKSHSTCSLRQWGLRVAQSKGYKVAYVACARKLAVLMHHLWVTGQEFDAKR